MTIHCTILVFAQLTDTFNASQLALNLPTPATVNDALDALQRDHPGLEPHRATLAVAVNEHYAALDTVLHDGDTIALIPPVSGG